MNQHEWSESGRELPSPQIFAGLRPNIQLKYEKLVETPKWLSKLTNGDYLQWRDECLLENLVNHAEITKVLQRMEGRAYARRPIVREKRKRRDWQAWTQFETETLIKMKLEGKNYREIAKFLGTNKERIKSKWLIIVKDLKEN